eukprot:Pgem_evm1s17263
MSQAEEIDGQFTEDSAFDLGLAKSESLAWIEAVLQEKLASNEDFHSGLKDGQRLCRFVNCIKPKAVKRINKSKSPFPSMENLEAFLQACRGIGLKDTVLFTASTFHGGNESGIVGSDQKKAQADQQKVIDKIMRDVCINIYWLGVAVRAMPDYKGPQLNLAAFMKLACTRCQQEINDNDYVVAQGRQFHNECFHCDTCQKNPIDPNENFKWDNYHEHLSCEKCRCTKCKECVLPGKYRALDDGPISECKKICPSCDTENKCTTCKSILDPNDTHTHNGKKYCPSCVCADEECKKPFKNNEFGVVDGKKYCPDCLCNNCKQLAGPDHVVKNNKKYCPDCYCADDKCKKPFVNNKYKEVDGKRYCPDCLCSNCENLAGEDFVTKDGKKFCKDCHCADEKCKKPFVNNKFKEVDGKRYCPDCLCSNCDELAGEDFVTKNGKKFCKNCHCADDECKKPFVNNEFKEIDGKRYCPDCLCSNCNDLAGPDAIVSDGKKYCPNCYCADTTCGKPFVNNEFKEIDGKRYCPDCICSREGCGKHPSDPVKVDGKKYCPTCVCADDECQKPLVDGEYVEAPAAGNFPGGNVCKSCLCALCSTYVGKYAYIRRKGDKFCENCACGGCKIPLKEGTDPRTPEKSNPAGKRYCHHCVCSLCDKGLGRRDKRINYAGGQYCSDCVCVICSKAFTGRLQDTQKPFEKGSACGDCQCFACGDGVAKGDRSKYGNHQYCKKCLCTGCSKPSTDVRGELTEVNKKMYCTKCLCHTCATPLGKDGKDGIDHGDFSYCKKCVCGNCSSPVEEETKTMKGPKAYCPKCVCCQCSTVVTEDKYVMFGDYVTCLRCACARCGRPEKPTGEEPQPAFKKSGGKGYCTKCT